MKYLVPRAQGKKHVPRVLSYVVEENSYNYVRGIEEWKGGTGKKKRRILKMENFSKRETLEAGVWDEESFKAVIFEIGKSFNAEIYKMAKL